MPKGCPKVAKQIAKKIAKKVAKKAAHVMLGDNLNQILTSFDIPKLDCSIIGRRDYKLRVELKARHSRIMLIWT